MPRPAPILCFSGFFSFPFLFHQMYPLLELLVGIHAYMAGLGVKQGESEKPPVVKQGRRAVKNIKQYKQIQNRNSVKKQGRKKKKKNNN